MICTEVGELMQRQLDHDLDEQELTLLMTHLGECKACQGLFERLTLLSGSLEQLPRVTPSISIVDSILPELEAIDRQREQQQEKIVKAARWKRWMTAAASVAAAAAVVLLMTNLDNSDKAANTAADSVAMSQISSGTASNNDSSPAAAPTSREFNSNAMVEDLSRETTEADSGYHITPLSSPIESMKIENYPSDEFKVSHNETKELAPAVEEEANTSQDNSLPKANEKTNSQSSTVNGNKSSTTEQQTGTESAVQITSKDQSGANVGPEQVENQGGDKELQGEFLNSAMGITGDDLHLEKHFSPDGLVYIVLNGHTIELYETSTAMKLNTWDIEPTGSLNFVEWDNSSKFFVYEQSDSEGTLSRHIINLEN